MKRVNPDSKYNPFITMELTQSEWNELIMCYSIYDKADQDWKEKLLNKLKDQDVPVPHWAFSDPNSPGEGFRRGGYLGDAID